LHLVAIDREGEGEPSPPHSNQIIQFHKSCFECFRK
jgi:hypothetical protein